jgi:hypothetical protein
MSKLVVGVVVALTAVAVAAGGASAATVQKITPYRCPVSSGGFNTGGVDQNGNPIPDHPVVSAAESGGPPVSLQFGWAATQTSQLDSFLRNEDGTVSVGPTPGSNLTFFDAWDPTNTSGWSAYFATPLLLPNGNSFSGYGTKRFESIGTLSNPTPNTSVTYYLNMTWHLSQTVTDGPGSTVPAGSIITITDCPIEVHNYNP